MLCVYRRAMRAKKEMGKIPSVTGQTDKTSTLEKCGIEVLSVYGRSRELVVEHIKLGLR
jgi:hypothetical protein